MVLATARLSLRAPEDADVDALRAYHARNAGRFAPWEPQPGDDPAVHAGWVRMRQAEACAGQPATFLAFEGGAPELAGIISLTGFSSQPPSALLSYSIDGAREGRGYASEAVGRVVEYAFAELGLDRLSAQYDPANERSARLLQRLGFRVVASVPVIPGFERLMRAHVLVMRDRLPGVTS